MTFRCDDALCQPERAVFDVRWEGPHQPTRAAVLRGGSAEVLPLPVGHPFQRWLGGTRVYVPVTVLPRRQAQ